MLPICQKILGKSLQRKYLHCSKGCLQFYLLYLLWQEIKIATNAFHYVGGKTSRWTQTLRNKYASYFNPNVTIAVLVFLICPKSLPIWYGRNSVRGLGRCYQSETHRSLIDHSTKNAGETENLSQKPFVTHQNYLDGLFDQPIQQGTRRRKIPIDNFLFNSVKFLNEVCAEFILNFGFHKFSFATAGMYELPSFLRKSWESYVLRPIEYQMPGSKLLEMRFLNG